MVNFKNQIINKTKGGGALQWIFNPGFRVSFSGFCRPAVSLLLITAVSLLMTCSRLYSYTYRNSFYEFGDNITGLSGASAAHGGAACAVAGDPAALFGNPAATISEQKSLMFGLGYSSVYERRVRNDKDDTTAINKNIIFDFSGAAISYPLMGNKLTITAGETLLSDFNYTYMEQQFSAVQRTAKNGIESEGQLRGVGGAAAHKLHPKLTAGIAAYGVYGAPESSMYSILYGTTPADRGMEVVHCSTTVAHSFSGSFITLGALYSLTDRLDLGLSYSPGMEITDKQTITGKDCITGSVLETAASYNYKYPRQIAAGLQLRFPGPSFPTVTVDLVHTNWSAAKEKQDSGQWTDCGWSDTLAWHVGAQHVVHDKTLRYGLGFLPDYSLKGSNKIVVSGGLGFKLWIMEFDAAAQYYMRRNTLENRHFQVEANPSYPRINLVTADDYVMRILLSGKIKW